MSPAFIKGIREHLGSEPHDAYDDNGIEVAAALGHQPEVVFDRFHVVAEANDAVDEVRRAESKTRPVLQRSRYVWLKNDANLTVKQREKQAWLTRPSMNPQTARGACWRDDVNGFYEQPIQEAAQAFLRRWCTGAKRSRLEPIKTFVPMIEAHWDRITSWQVNRISNRLLEETKRRARGYRNKDKKITINCLIAGNLPRPQSHTI